AQQVDIGLAEPGTELIGVGELLVPPGEGDTQAVRPAQALLADGFEQALRVAAFRVDCGPRRIDKRDSLRARLAAAHDDPPAAQFVGTEEAKRMAMLTVSIAAASRSMVIGLVACLSVA